MSDHDISELVRDVDLVEQMLSRIATEDEAAAARRILGVEREANRLSVAFAPRMPSPEFVGSGVDELTVARESLARYRSWVDSFPDDDPTPLVKRERAARLAAWSVERLEAKSGDSG